MRWTNYHTHSHYCDGKKDLEDFVKKAIELNMAALGFSGHSPVPFESDWNIQYQDLLQYFEEIESLKQKYEHEIVILRSLEIDFIPGVTGPDVFKAYKLDYTLGAVHYLKRFDDGIFWDFDESTGRFTEGLEKIFKGDIKKMVEAYYLTIIDMVKHQTPDIIAHFDLVKKFNKENRFFDDSEKWYMDIVKKTLDEVKKNGCIVEVNTRGLYKGLNDTFYPTTQILNECNKRSIPVTINADAHHPDELILCFHETVQMLKKNGYTERMVNFGNGWESQQLTMA